MNGPGKIFGTLVFVGIVVVVFFVDQILKRIVLSIPKGSFFIISKNKGIAFGISWIPLNVVIFLTIIFLGIIVYSAVRNIRQNKIFFLMAQALIVAGGCSNLYDRIFRKEIIDYLYFPWYSNFNIADIAIVAGIIGWMLLSIKNDVSLDP